jgi:hypothetical protein
MALFMKPTKSLLLVLSAIGALAALIVAPSASAAGLVAPTQACFVAGSSGETNVGVTGSGFTPGEEIFAQIPAPGGLLGYVDTTVAPDGTVNATIENIFPEVDGPAAETVPLQIKGILSGLILAESSVSLTNLAVATKPPTANYGKVVEYLFSGFRPGKKIYGHYFRGGKLALTHKFGKASGPCGLLQTKSKLFPGHGPRTASYKVQFDDSKKVNPKATPKIVTTLGAAF